MRILAAAALMIALSTALFGQQRSYADDTRALLAAGKVENNAYVNQHAGFLLHLPRTPCNPRLNLESQPEKGYALLLNCMHDVEGGGAYSFSIQVESWSHYGPRLVSLDQYMRGLRRLGQQDPNDRSRPDPNSKIVEYETPRKWAGLDFEEVIMTMRQGDSLHYVGVTCTHLKDYALCFRGEAATLEMVRALISLDHKLEIAGAEPK